MAQGHIIPFLALAVQIQRRKDYTITFVNTPLNIRNLRESLPPNSSNIHLLEIPFFSSDHGLPPDSENTDVLPPHLIFHFFLASPSLKPAFEKLISGLITDENGRNAPLCIVADIFLGWTVDVAHKFGVFHVIFSGAGGFGLACYYSLWVNLPHRKTGSDEFWLPDFLEAGKLETTQLSPSLVSADGTDPPSVFQASNLPKWLDSDGFLFNTIEEFDNIGLNYFRRKMGKPVWPIGPILLSVKAPPRTGKTAGISPELCNRWLDTKPTKSVLYISFGSQNSISAQHMMQLAIALEASGKNFIWVIRPPMGFDINSKFKAEEWLPEGFEERNQNRGLLVYSWAPQVEILSHKAISAFLSHCGWNSVLEALTRGVPIIGWPISAEQFYNVKLLEEKIGVCVEVARESIGEVKHEDIVGKLELLMNETDEGKEMRKRSCEVQEMIKNAFKDEEGFKGSSVEGMDNFLNAAHCY